MDRTNNEPNARAGARADLTVRIRRARPGDVDGLARVHVASWCEAYAGIIEPENLERTNMRRSLGRFQGYFWRGGQQRSLLLVAELDGEIIGYVNAGVSTRRDLARGEVYELYVAPQHQGRGVGRKLLCAGLWALATAKRAPALIWVLADNHRARRFYESMRGKLVARAQTRVGEQELAKVAYLWTDYLPWPEHLVPRKADA